MNNKAEEIIQKHVDECNHEDKHYVMFCKDHCVTALEEYHQSKLSEVGEELMSNSNINEACADISVIIGQAEIYRRTFNAFIKMRTEASKIIAKKEQEIENFKHGAECDKNLINNLKYEIEQLKSQLEAKDKEIAILKKDHSIFEDNVRQLAKELQEAKSANTSQSRPMTPRDKEAYDIIQSQRRIGTVASPQKEREEGTDAVEFNNWINESEWLWVYSDTLKKGAYINCTEHTIYKNGSDFHFTLLVINHGASTKELYAKFKSHQPKKD